MSRAAAMNRSGGFSVLLAVLIVAVSVACQPGLDDEAERVGSAKVSWDPPTQREDGSTLTTISGYTIYFGRDPENLEHTIEVSGELTEYEIEGLEEGTWYFAVTAKSDTGVESQRSPVVSKTI
jgi:hypothetical protein